MDEANAIYQEDVDMCRRIGENGERFINNGAGILTHCNAGALATAGQGTALSVMFEAHKKGPASFNGFMEKQKSRSDDLARKFDQAREKSKSRLKTIGDKISLAKKHLDEEGGKPDHGEHS